MENEKITLVFAPLKMYDVWGAVTSPRELKNNDNGNFAAAVFTGHPYDTVLDIYFAEARFYDANHRQWMSVDPIKSGLNWYLYCYANPAMLFAPNGGSAPVIVSRVPIQIGGNDITAIEEDDDENMKILDKGATVTIGKAIVPESHSSVSITHPITKPIRIFEKWHDFYDWSGDNEFNGQW